MQVVGARSGAAVTGIDQLPGTANYFLGKDPSQWRTSIPTYAKVRYDNLYPGVDLVYYGNQRQLEYDFIVAPSARPEAIRLSFTGARALKLEAEHNLVIAGAHGEIAFRKPEIYQVIDGSRRPVQGSFRLRSPGKTVSFHLGRYDRSRPLVIDPVLSYSTYLAYHPDGQSFASSIAVDGAGNAYVVGQVQDSWEEFFQLPERSGGHATPGTTHSLQS